MLDILLVGLNLALGAIAAYEYKRAERGWLESTRAKNAADGMWSVVCRRTDELNAARRELYALQSQTDEALMTVGRDDDPATAEWIANCNAAADAAWKGGENNEDDPCLS